MFLYRKHLEEQNSYEESDDQNNVQTLHDENVRDQRWFSIPRLFSLQMFRSSKSCRNQQDEAEYDVQKNQLANLQSALSLLHHSRKAFRILCYFGSGLNEAVLLTIKNGLILIEATTKPSCGGNCERDYGFSTCRTCSSSFVYRCVSGNRQNIIAFCEETIPAILEQWRDNAVSVAHFVQWAQPMVFEAGRFSYSLVKTTVGQCCFHAFDLVYVFQKLSRYLFYINSGVYQMLMDTECQNFYHENRQAALTVFLIMVKSTSKVAVHLFPMIIRSVKVAHKITDLCGTKIRLASDKLFEEIPELKYLLSEAYGQFCSISSTCSETVLPLVVSPNPEVIGYFGDLTQIMGRVVRQGTPVAGLVTSAVFTNAVNLTPVVAHFTFRTLKTLFPAFVCVVTPLTRTMQCWNLSPVFWFVSRSGRQAASVMYFCVREGSSLILNDSLLIYLFAVVKGASFGVISATRDITPMAKDDICYYAPLLKNGISVLAKDTYAGAKIVAPAIGSCTRAILSSAVFSVREVSPVIFAAFLVVQPDLLKACTEVTSTSYSAFITVSRDLTKASLVVGPVIVHSVQVMKPVFRNAIIEVSPAVISASAEIGTSLRFSILEIRRTYLIALTKMTGSLSRGVTTVISDVTDALCVIMNSAETSLDELNSAVTTAIDASFVSVMTSLHEVHATIRILGYLKSSSLPSAGGSELTMTSGANITTLTTKIRRRSQSMLLMTQKVALYSKVFVSKRNIFALALIYDTNVQIMKSCYEKVEPLMLQIYANSYSRLSVILGSNNVIRVASISSQLALGFCFIIPLGVYLSKMSLSSAIRFDSNLVQTLMKNITHSSILFTYKALIKAVQLNCFVCPILWKWVRLISPELWSVIIKVTPVIWTSYCSICRETWNVSTTIAPILYSNFSESMARYWYFTKSKLPGFWTRIVKISPRIWATVCEMCSILWTFICSQSPAYWAAIQNTFPILWRSFCSTLSSFWHVNCDLNATIWCFLVHGMNLSWEFQTLVSKMSWNALTASSMTFWSRMKASQHVCYLMLKAGQTVLLGFLATIAFFAVYGKLGVEGMRVLVDPEQKYREYDTSNHPSDNVLDIHRLATQDEIVKDSRTVRTLQKMVDGYITVRSWTCVCRNVFRKIGEIFSCSCGQTSIRNTITARSRRLSQCFAAGKAALTSEFGDIILNGRQLTGGLY